MMSLVLQAVVLSDGVIESEPLAPSIAETAIGIASVVFAVAVIALVVWLVLRLKQR